MKEKIVQFAPSIIVSIIAILVCFAVLDFIWLGLIAGDLYQSAMASFIRKEIIIWPWLVFYISYGLVVFVLAVVANRDKSFLYACIDGGLLGLASYGTYNLTNYSLVQDFPLHIALIDWTWGMCLTAASAGCGWLGFQMMRKD